MYIRWDNCNKLYAKELFIEVAMFVHRWYEQIGSDRNETKQKALFKPFKKQESWYVNCYIPTLETKNNEGVSVLINFKEKCTKGGL